MTGPRMYSGKPLAPEPLSQVIVMSGDAFVSVVRAIPANGAQAIAAPDPPVFEPEGVIPKQRPSVLLA